MSTEQTNSTSGNGASGGSSVSGRITRLVHRGREGRASRRVYELVRLVAHALVPIVAHLRVEGLEHVPPHGAAILAPNHISSVDIPLVAYPIPRVTHFMAKAELFHARVLGGFIRLLGAFPVRRGESDREALRVAERLLADGQVVAIFPEGHRSEGCALIEAHTGVALIAMRAEVPVIPVAIWGSEQALHGWRYLWNRPTVTICYGAPVTLRTDGTRRTSADVKRGTDEIMGRVAAMLPPRYRGIYAHLVASGTSGPTVERAPASAPSPTNGQHPAATTADETPAQPS
jgi:1-acyl-sn-glycerol-3-phosphate acyltransferase